MIIDCNVTMQLDYEFVVGVLCPLENREYIKWRSWKFVVMNVMQAN